MSAAQEVLAPLPVDDEALTALADCIVQQMEENAFCPPCGNGAASEFLEVRQVDGCAL